LTDTAFDLPRYLTSFDPQTVAHMFPDVLILGTGVAGLRAAVEAARHDAKVLVVTKAQLRDSNSWQAQGGIAGALSDSDNWQSHRDDTLLAGHHLCDEEVVSRVVRHGPERIHELVDWGASFDQEGGRLALTREGGHSCNRVAHARGDATGREIVSTLLDRVQREPGIRLLEDAFATDLLTIDGTCYGAVVSHPARGTIMIWASAVVLATGGLGRVYRETTNPPVATGDGLAMALRAGAVLRDMEFIQFHPTILYVAGGFRCLVSEAVRGEGAYLRDKNGERFMDAHDPRAELAPRDVVSRAITQRMHLTRHPCVYLDLRHIAPERVYLRFPMIRQVCSQFDLDIARDLIPVRPGAHYTIGGVAVDPAGRSSLRSLWAIGEAACTGLHGANRLGSNSLLEGLEFGAEVGRQVADAARAGDEPMTVREIASARPDREATDLDLRDVTNSLQSLMSRQVGIDRHGDSLGEALQNIDFWSRYVLPQTFAEPEGWELQNMLVVARAVTASAQFRRESRGVHYRRDFPESDDANWKRTVFVSRDSGVTLDPPSIPGPSPSA